MTIVEFLLARIAEDEAVARRGVSSQADPENGWGYRNGALTPHVGIIHEAAQAEHIIRWHPARVLAECKSKRRIIDASRRAETEGGSAEIVMFDGWPRDGVWPVLAALALPYAPHPDYRMEWRP